MTPRTVRADAAVRQGRLAKAEQFATAATVVQDLADEAADGASEEDATSSTDVQLEALVGLLTDALAGERVG